MSKIDKQTIFDSFWQPFSDGLDSLEKSESDLRRIFAENGVK